MITSINKIIDSSNLGEDLEGIYHLPKYNWKSIILNRYGTKISSLDDVEKFHTGFTWDKEDNDVNYWVPQGITGLREGEDKKFIVVSWYHKNEVDPDFAEMNKGVRLSFVDVTEMDNIKYRHVLLVEPTADQNKYPIFQPVEIHAGGIAAIDSTIYVADTYNGIRVFNADKLFKVWTDPEKEKSLCGIIPSAFDYLYIMPQVRKYELNQKEAYFSFASIDWSNIYSPKLITGNYHDEDDNVDAEPTIAWWNLEGKKIISRDIIMNKGLKDKCQGVQALNGNLMLSCSGDSDYRGLYVGKKNDFKKHVWPSGCEDLHYSPFSGNLWCLTEHAKDRFVFAVKATDYLK